jgi:hypothetical protein
LPYPIMHNAQVRLEAGEGSIEIDSFSFVPRLDSIPISISISISNGASPNLGLMLTAFPYVSFCHILQPSGELQKKRETIQHSIPISILYQAPQALDTLRIIY